MYKTGNYHAKPAESPLKTLLTLHSFKTACYGYFKNFILEMNLKFIFGMCLTFIFGMYLTFIFGMY